MLNLLKGTTYLVIYVALIYLYLSRYAYLTLYLVCAMIPLIVIRQIDLRRNLRKKVVKNRAGFIYGFSDVAQIIPTVKIGRSSDRDSRLRSHRTAAPFGIITWCNFRVADTVYSEAFLHHHYRMWRVSKRNEFFYWFNVLILIDLILLGWFRPKD